MVTMQADPGNLEQLRAWDGDEGAFWAAHAEAFDRAVAAYHPSFMESAAIRATDRVLDIGCGNGQTTRDAAQAASAGTAHGVDLSSPMLVNARRLAASEGPANVTFQQADAQIHRFAPESFDVAISRMGVIFFSDLAAGLANINRALRPAGRLVLLTWQPVERQEWLPALAGALAAGRDLSAPPAGAPGPFSLSDPEQVRTILQHAGFQYVEFAGLEEPMYFGASPEDAYEFVLGLLGWMLNGLDEGRRERALQALWATLRAHHGPAGVTFGSATWRVTARK